MFVEALSPSSPADSRRPSDRRRKSSLLEAGGSASKLLTPVTGVTPGGRDVVL